MCTVQPYGSFSEALLCLNKQHTSPGAWVLSLVCVGEIGNEYVTFLFHVVGFFFMNVHRFQIDLALN